jgi:hypothetical protein
MKAIQEKKTEINILKTIILIQIQAKNTIFVPLKKYTLLLKYYRIKYNPKSKVCITIQKSFDTHNTSPTQDLPFLIYKTP